MELHFIMQQIALSKQKNKFFYRHPRLLQKICNLYPSVAVCLSHRIRHSCFSIVVLYVLYPVFFPLQFFILVLVVLYPSICSTVSQLFVLYSSNHSSVSQYSQFCIPVFVVLVSQWLVVLYPSIRSAVSSYSWFFILVLVVLYPSIRSSVSQYS